MRTRRANYPPLNDNTSSICSEAPFPKRPRLMNKLNNNDKLRDETNDSDDNQLSISGSKSRKSNGFDSLHDDLLLSILASLSSRSESSVDLINAGLTCKRFQKLAFSEVVLAKASVGALKIKPEQWIKGGGCFIEKCASAGNTEACYTLGMVRFYCLMDRKSGLQMLGRAAACSHAAALHALGVIQFNGSGGTRADKNLKAGVRLCARAASLGHVDAMRELGHCLQDGYGVAKNITDGRRLILEANLREAMGAAQKSQYPLPPLLNVVPWTTAAAAVGSTHQLSQLLSDFGANVPPPAPHIANQFLVSWFHTWRQLSADLRMCSHPSCGRPETRKHEFRRCSACASVNYCSRACQALHWKMEHKASCCANPRTQQHLHQQFRQPPSPPLDLQQHLNQMLLLLQLHQQRSLHRLS